MNLGEKFNDKKIWHDLQENNQEVFAKVYDKNIKDIYRFIYFKVSNKEEAQDLSSTVFLKAWNYIQNNNIDHHSSIRALLYKIARNLVIDYYRQKKEKLSLDNEDKHIQIADVNDILSNIDSDKQISLIIKNLYLLKEEYREIIILRFVNQLELSEIAKILKKSKGNVRVILHRALGSLRKIVKDD